MSFMVVLLSLSIEERRFRAEKSSAWYGGALSGGNNENHSLVAVRPGGHSGRYRSQLGVHVRPAQGCTLTKGVPFRRAGHAAHRADGSTLGPNGCDAPESFFLETKEGWVYVSEGAFPTFSGFWMAVFDMAGEGQATPSTKRTPGQPKSCR
jgi:hypothetical protein